MGGRSACMPTEFESRYLVQLQDLQDARQRSDIQLIDILDIYLESKDAQTPPMRIRHSINRMIQGPHRTSTVLTTKFGSRGAAEEYEWEWPSKQWPLDKMPSFIPAFGPSRVGPRVIKARHQWHDGNRLYHIEELLDPKPPAGELIAEVEFPSAEAKTAFVPPAHWIDITTDVRYSNFALAKFGWPPRSPL